ncbi:sirohydrochlorin chelatase [Paenibacillus cucumis (ex Kampfer et al. 2016)]|uniref:Sirohydrochlorin chelatase n=1 Tax=Paenibacillus cucumis (ex Kampfer et al. 2016) TaxID=1776858 RepID=A0ABS7KJG1_9BACL|nr:sirohydrochlorin chelatase [Paenibacillus cucumis (ex Kampfer et al. 2016)]MBY0204136.1 sirohydrochlorin chelatase [Paenibacillus cucumis (ex Kampfer et al. 2016)]
MDAILLVGHGSRDPEGNRELKEFAREVAEQAPENTMVETCFLELTRPSIADGVTACVDRGATRVVLVPIILFAAGHAKIDIPNAIDRAKARYPQVQFIYGRPIGVHEKVVQIMQTRLQEAQPVRITAQGEGETDTAVAVAAPPATVTDEETAVLVLGRGSSDPDANSDFFKMTRMLWEKLPYRWAESSFIGVTQPSFPDGLERCLLLGAKKIIVMPYFLFTGVLIKRIDEMTAEFAAAHPDIQVEIGGYFGFHPKLVELVLERAHEGLYGRVTANCDNCQFRLEAAKHHHHHHDHDHGHDHDHDHDHHHDHHHHDHHDHGHDHGHDHHHHEHDHHDHSHDHKHSEHAAEAASTREATLDFHHDHDEELHHSHHEHEGHRSNQQHASEATAGDIQQHASSSQAQVAATSEQVKRS